MKTTSVLVLVGLFGAGPFPGAMASPLQAQGPPHVLATESYSVGWPSDMGSSDFTRGTSATMLQGDYPDLFCIRGGLLVRMSEAGFYNSFEPVGGLVVDVATVAGAGMQPETDGVAMVGGNGLQLVQVDPATLLCTVLTIDASLTTGIQVRSADVDGNGSADIAVLLAGGEEVRFYTRTSGTWGLLGSLTFLGADIADFDLARLDGVAGSELVVAVPDGFDVYGLSWPGPVATLQKFRHGPAYHSGQVETLANHVAPGVDGFAWTTYALSVNRWLLLGVTASANQPPEILPAGFDVVSMTAAPFLQIEDEPSDLLIVVQDPQYLHGFSNLGSSASSKAFAFGTDHFPIETGITSGTQHVTPIVADFDGTLAAELFLGNMGQADVTVYYDFSPTLEGQNPMTVDFDWEWVPGSALPLPYWYFSDSSVNLPPSTYSEVTAVVISDQDLAAGPPTVPRMTAILWGADALSPTILVNPQIIAICHDVEWTLIGTNPNVYRFVLPVGAAGSPTPPGMMQEIKQFFALHVMPEGKFADGSSPSLFMALGNNLGDLVDNMDASLPFGYDENSISNISGLGDGLSGTGITLGSIKLKRVKKIPGTPQPTPLCSTSPPS